MTKTLLGVVGKYKKLLRLWLWTWRLSFPSSCPLPKPGSPAFLLSLGATQCPANKFLVDSLGQSQFESFEIKNLDLCTFITEAYCLPARISQQCFVWSAPTFSLTTIHWRGYFKRIYNKLYTGEVAIIITLTLKVWQSGLIEMNENTNVQILALILSSDFGRIFLPLFTVLSLKRKEWAPIF